MNLAPVFSGRWDELYLFAQCRDQAQRGQPQILLIEGEPGIGKSALLGAFAAARGAHERKPRVFTLKPAAAGEYDPVHEAVSALTARRLYQKVGGRSAAKDLAFEWIGAIPGAGDLMAALGATADAVRRRQVRKGLRGITIDEDVEALLIAARRPLILLFDDLHLADTAAVGRLETLIRAAGRPTRLLLVGAFRPPPRGGEESPIRRLVRALPAGSAHHRKLRALTPKEVALWLDKQFPRALKPASFLDWLYESTGGHPGTLHGTLGHLLDQSTIRFAGGHWEIDADPGRHEVAKDDDSAAALGALQPEVAEVLRPASALGEEFDGTSLARRLGRDELQVEDRLALAVHQGLVHVVGEIDLPDGDIATRYRFSTPYLRSALLRSLPAAERTRLESGVPPSPVP